MISCEVNTDPECRIKGLVTALKCIADLYRQHRPDWDRATEQGNLDLSKQDPTRLNHPKIRHFDDVSRGEFFLYYASLYELVAETINKGLTQSEQRYLQQSSILVQLTKLNDDFLTNNNPEPAQALGHFSHEISATASKEVRHHQLLMLTANCYRVALKILLKVRDGERQIPQIMGFANLRAGRILATPISNEYLTLPRWDLFFITFDGLVHFYLEHQCLDELAILLNKKAEARFKTIPHFMRVLPSWRKLLREKLKETGQYQKPIKRVLKKTKLNSFD